MTIIIGTILLVLSAMVGMTCLGWKIRGEKSFSDIIQSKKFLACIGLFLLLISMACAIGYHLRGEKSGVDNDREVTPIIVDPPVIKQAPSEVPEVPKEEKKVPKAEAACRRYGDVCVDLLSQDHLYVFQFEEMEVRTNSGRRKRPMFVENGNYEALYAVPYLLAFLDESLRPGSSFHNTQMILESGEESLSDLARDLRGELEKIEEEIRRPPEEVGGKRFVVGGRKMTWKEVCVTALYLFNVFGPAKDVSDLQFRPEALRIAHVRGGWGIEERTLGFLMPYEKYHLPKGFREVGSSCAEARRLVFAWMFRESPVRGGMRDHIANLLDDAAKDAMVVGVCGGDSRPAVAGAALPKTPPHASLAAMAGM